MRIILISLAALLVGCATAPVPPAASPSPLHASQPVPVNRVISAAIWVNPLDAARSRVIIANATRGLEVHDLDGYLLKHLDDTVETDSVTVLRGFPLAGKTVDLLLATMPDARVQGVKAYCIDAEKAKLKALPAGDTFKVPGDGDALGIAAYRSRATGKCYAFVTRFDGVIDQFELATDAAENLTARPVRRLNAGGKIHECIADEDRGVIYVSQMKTGVLEFAAEPDGGDRATLIIKANDHGLIPDVEGVALYATGPTDGYLIVVGQGLKSDRSRFNVYDRRDAHFVGSFVPSAAGGNAIEFSAGIAATATPLPGYPQGLLVIKDHINANASEDFKYFSWADIARLLRLK